MTFEENFATATCKFLQWQPSSDKRYQSNCSIVYGYKLRFPVGSESIMGLSLNDTVIFNLSIHEIPSKQEYQFIVTATNGTFTAQVMGTFSKFYTSLLRDIDPGKLIKGEVLLVAEVLCSWHLVLL